MADELEKKHVVLLNQFADELREVQLRFNQYKSNPPVHNNLPPVAGALYWCRGLLARIQVPMERLRAVTGELLQGEEALPVVKAYTALVASLGDFEHKKAVEWASNVEASSSEKLRLPLLMRLPGGLLKVNFDPSLVRLLREVKYFLLLGLNVPESALAIFDRAETYRKHTGNMELVVNMYNNIISNLLPVEKPLLQPYLEKIDSVLAPGLKTLNWKSHGIDLFVTESMNSVRHTSQLVGTMNSNLGLIQSILDSWAAEPMFLKSGKPATLRSLEERMEKQFKARYLAMAEGGRTIAKLLKDTNRRLKVSPGVIDWRCYVDFVNSIVVHGLQKVATTTLDYVTAQLDPVTCTKDGRPPLMEIELDLNASQVAFEPPVRPPAAAEAAAIKASPLEAVAEVDPDEEDAGAGAGPPPAGAAETKDGGSASKAAQRVSVRSCIWSLVDRVFRIGTLFPRLDQPEGNYVRELKVAPEVQGYLAAITQHLQQTESLCTELRDKFLTYSHLWERSLHEVFHEFLRYSTCAVGDKAPNLSSRAVGRRKSSSVTPIRTHRKVTAKEVDVPAVSSPFPIKPSWENRRARVLVALRLSSPREAESPGGRGTDEGSLAWGDPSALEKLDPVTRDLAKTLVLPNFTERIDSFRSLQEELSQIVTSVDLHFLRINAGPIRQALSTLANKWMYQFTSYLTQHITGRLCWLRRFSDSIRKGLDAHIKTANANRADLMAVMSFILDVRQIQEPTSAMFGPMMEVVELLKAYGHTLKDERVAHLSLLSFLDQAKPMWEDVVNYTYKAKEQIQSQQGAIADAVKRDVTEFGAQVDRYAAEVQDTGPYRMSRAQSTDEAYSIIDRHYARLLQLESRQKELEELEALFELQHVRRPQLKTVRSDLKGLKHVWDMVGQVRYFFEFWGSLPWIEVDAEELLDQCKRLASQVRMLPPSVRGWDVFTQLTEEVSRMVYTLPLVMDLQYPAIKERHWRALQTLTGSQALDPALPEFRLCDLLDCDLYRHREEVNNLVELALKQAKIEHRLGQIDERWAKAQLKFVPYQHDLSLLAPLGDIADALEEDMLRLQTMVGMGKYVEFFRDRVLEWQRTLSEVELTLRLWFRVQSQWHELEAIFMGSADLRAALPEQAKLFEGIDADFRELMRSTEGDPSVIAACTHDGKKERLQGMIILLERCQKALWHYLEVKKKAFPRFYFVSNLVLMNILANSKNPEDVMPFLGDCFASLRTLILEPSKAFEEGDNLDSDPVKDKASAMIATDGEVVYFPSPLLLQGSVESWLSRVEDSMHNALQNELERALDAATQWAIDQPRDAWAMDFPAQTVLVASQVMWTEEVENALNDAETGQEETLKTCYHTCVQRLKKLVSLIGERLSDEERAKIMSLITLDVHAKDIVAHLVDKRIASPLDFSWQAQLRYYWTEEKQVAELRVGEFTGTYGYDYCGNSGRLVITPLTDRCYLTLTTALRLFLGGAPAGPAGTGKTETTKDLSKAHGLPCYVFNCNDQMNYMTMANIFKGLASTGAWGCFDEFNRISVEVLSVVATQVSLVLDAVRLLSVPKNRPPERANTPAGRPPVVVGFFDFLGDKVNLVPTAGVFVTMNPGYSGRTELPENVKALFRPCAMMKPDLALICENILLSEGYHHGRELGGKIVTLYNLAAEFLSPQKHYDWGLRAIKSVLRMAGRLRRGQIGKYDTSAIQHAAETEALLASIVAANEPKVVEADLPLFYSLLNNTFHGKTIPKRVTAASTPLLREAATRVALRQGLQPEDGFLAKIEQLYGVMQVRHSVMILGPAGSGKTSVWRVLGEAMGEVSPPERCIHAVLNPKALSPEELYQKMTLTNDWQDGPITIVMRKMSKGLHPYDNSYKAKWIVLDGDIDAAWIETMNSVMDDNKVLTLVSNERIPFTDSMRLVFEADNLQHATPATVSRAGMVYLNESDIGWRAVLESWLASREDGGPVHQAGPLPALFDRYVPLVFRAKADFGWQFVLPTSRISLLQGLCTLLGGLLDAYAAERGLLPSGVPVSREESGQLEGRRARAGKVLSSETGEGEEGGAPAEVEATSSLSGIHNLMPPDTLEAMFLFALAWSIGGLIEVEGSALHWRNFSKALDEEMKGSFVPSTGTVFDFFLACAVRPVPTSTRGDAGATPTTTPATAPAAAGGGSGPTPSNTNAPGASGDGGFGGEPKAPSLAPVDAGLRRELLIAYPDRNAMQHLLQRETFVFVPWAAARLEAPPIISEVGGWEEVVVPTTQTLRVQTLLNFTMKAGKPTLFIGGNGVGKTLLAREYLRSQTAFPVSRSLSLNYFTSARRLQAQLEGFLEKRSGTSYGPPGMSKMLLLVDDFNLPAVDEWGTQLSHALIRQWLEWGGWYDRSDFTVFKLIQDMHVLGSLNPLRGSRTINPRLQRHFFPINIPAPTKDHLTSIFGAILDAHLESGFTSDIGKFAPVAVRTIVDIAAHLGASFKPSAVNFHYIFSPKDIAAVFRGLFCVSSQHARTTLDFARAVLNECERVFGDRLSSGMDRTRYTNIVQEVAKKEFDLEAELLFRTPNMFTWFASVGDTEDPAYLSVQDITQLQEAVSRGLERYNDASSVMDLVIFPEAALHVARLARLFAMPWSHALLVGVGGVGKRSLTRLAAFLSNTAVAELPSSRLSDGDMQEWLKDQFRKAGVKPAEPLALLVSESAVHDETLLRYFNDLLATGVPRDIYSVDELEGILSSVRKEAKAAGVPDTHEDTYKFFNDRVMHNLHLVFAFSPVGSALRQRIHKFPELLASTTCIWFHPWPKDALVSVAYSFLQGTVFLEEEEENAMLLDSLAYFMAEAHCYVEETAEAVYQRDHRRVFVTPKSFLSFCTELKSLSAGQRSHLLSQHKRLGVGLQRLKATEEGVRNLRIELQQRQAEVEKERQLVEGLLDAMGKEKEAAMAQQQLAAVEKEKAAKAAAEALKYENEAKEELGKAKPALDEAKNAVNCLNKPSLIELKSMQTPPSGVEVVTKCVLIMLNNERRNFGWDNAKRMMNKVEVFKDRLEDFDGASMSSDMMAQLEPLVPKLEPKAMTQKSVAAANLAQWVVSMVAYNKMYQKVKPLMERVEVAQAARNEAQEAFDHVRARLEEIEARLKSLQASYTAATNKKTRVEAEASACNDRLVLASRLVEGLSTEKERWSSEFDTIEQKGKELPGNVALSAAFITYAGAFDAVSREALWRQRWLRDLNGRDVLTTPDVTPLSFLVEEATRVEWQSQGLPADALSAENAAIALNASRTPLLVDPQSQAVEWLKRRYRFGENGDSEEGEEEESGEGQGSQQGREGDREDLGPLDVLRLDQANWRQLLAEAVRNGTTVLIENIGEELEPALMPVVTRAVRKSGRSLFLQVGEEEVEYNPRFRLILQTRLTNPVYPPEIQGECTILDFRVTKSGLRDQLLAVVVREEAPELEEQMDKLRASSASFELQLHHLENTLLQRLSDAPEDILSDLPLIEGLEATKETVAEISLAAKQTRATAAEVEKAREQYAPVADEASILFFLTLSLGAASHMYQFSLASFFRVFEASLRLVPKEARGDDEDSVAGSEIREAGSRVDDLVQAVRENTYKWVSRGLSEEHRLLYLVSVVLALLQYGSIGEDVGYSPELADALVRGPMTALKAWKASNAEAEAVTAPGLSSAVALSGLGMERLDLDFIAATAPAIPWLTTETWQSLQALSQFPQFRGLADDLEGNAGRFEEWVEHRSPEREKLPLDWRELDKRPFEKLLVVSVLRRDRLILALKDFVREVLGSDFLEAENSSSSTTVLKSSMAFTSPSSPVYFILSPGANATSDVAAIAGSYGKVKGKTLFTMSLGQGQEGAAQEMLRRGMEAGHWVMLDNLHLMPRWLPWLESLLEQRRGAHPEFRLFLSSDPSHHIPEAILSRSVKISCQPPQGFQSTLRRALAAVDPEEFNDLDARTKKIIFALCYFHAIAAERHRFGALGFNKPYPFSTADLRAAVLTAIIQLEAGGKAPWESLRYMIGQIIYGGHITDDWDRRVCDTHLKFLLRDAIFDGVSLYPFNDDRGAFRMPTATELPQFFAAVAEAEDLAHDPPAAFGMHENAEIGYRSFTAETLLHTMAAPEFFTHIVAPRSSAASSPTAASFGGSGGGGGGGDGLAGTSAAEEEDHRLGTRIQELLDEYGTVEFNTAALKPTDEEASPYQTVLYNETQTANSLLATMARSLVHLEAVLKGNEPATPQSEDTRDCLLRGAVPKAWSSAFACSKPLAGWLQELNARLSQLQSWSEKSEDLPLVVQMNALFNPRAFVNSILQAQAAKLRIDLDRLALTTEVTKKRPEDISVAPRDGVYVHGLYLEGARWDGNGTTIAPSLPRVLYDALPVVHIKAVSLGKEKNPSCVALPVYETRMRNQTYVFTAYVKTTSPPERWIIAGAALLLEHP